MPCSGMWTFLLMWQHKCALWSSLIIEIIGIFFLLFLIFSIYLVKGLLYELTLACETGWSSRTVCFYCVCVYMYVCIFIWGGKIEKSAIICWPYYWVSQKWFSLCECSSPNTEWADNLLSHTYIGHWWTREKKWLLHFLVFLLLFGFFFSLSLKWIKLHILPFLPPLYTKYSTVWVYLSLEDSSWPHI